VLNDRANQIAHRLRALGVGPGVLVAIGLPRTPDLVAALLAVAKAGGAYLPMDPAFPAQRLLWMLEDANPAVLVTDRALATRWPKRAARVLCLDDPAERLTEDGAANLAGLVNPDAPAYVIFTSGSTGRPKGVQISRRALVNFLTAMEREPGLSEGDRLLTARPRSGISMARPKRPSIQRPSESSATLRSRWVVLSPTRRCTSSAVRRATAPWCQWRALDRR